MDAAKPQARTIVTTMAANGDERHTPRVDEVMAVMEALSRLPRHRGAGGSRTGAFRAGSP